MYPTAAYYCPAGTDRQVATNTSTGDAGQYTVSLTGDATPEHRSGVQACPSGYVCIHGTMEQEYTLEGGICDLGSTHVVIPVSSAGVMTATELQLGLSRTSTGGNAAQPAVQPAQQPAKQSAVQLAVQPGRNTT